LWNMKKLGFQKLGTRGRLAGGRRNFSKKQE